MGRREGLLLALGVLLLVPGCEVSVFGSPPIQIIGNGVGTTGSTADPCGEPDDARRARTDADGCAERCAIDLAAGTTDCEHVRVGAPRAGAATIDLHDFDGVVATIEVCDPAGAVFQLADSPTADADGGDAGSTSHDAQLYLDGTTLHVRAADGSGVEPSAIATWVPAAGCTTRTLALADQLVYLVDADRGLCGPALLRVDPPSDDEGTADALWYVSGGGTIDGATTGGTGLRSISLCFW